MELKKKLYCDLKNYIVNVGWTHKIHIVYSDYLTDISKKISLVQIVASSMTTSGLIAIVFGKGSYGYNLFIAIIATVGLIMKGIEETTNPSELAKKEKSSANNFWRLREEGISLLSDIQYSTIKLECAQKKFNELVEKRNKYNSELENVPKKIVGRASDMIKIRKDNDYSEDYKYFIPEDLIRLKEEETK